MDILHLHVVNRIILCFSEECAGLLYCLILVEIQSAEYRAESKACASGRALPASMAASSAAAPGPKSGEGPVARAVLKIGPVSSLEVGIGNHPALTAALKQCVMPRCFACPTWNSTVQQMNFSKEALIASQLFVPDQLIG